jgi:hypothetical protein
MVVRIIPGETALTLMCGAGATNGGRVHDGAVAVGLQVRDGRSESGVDAGEVDPQHALPLGGFDVLQASEARCAGVVIEERQAAQLGHGGVHDVAHLVRIADIDSEGEAVNLLGHCFGRVPVDVKHGDPGTFFGHAPGGGSTDARSAAGDDGLGSIK